MSFPFVLKELKLQDPNLFVQSGNPELVPDLHPYTYNRRVETAEVVIAGAGIIGLSLALDLATRGISVIVLERGRAMAESSWAAAGMLAAHDPENFPQLGELAGASL